ncbi:GNAT superfamily N-acetyltransferase [Undibacterium sp. GrIS 1.8]|uniref:GNAT family N-acetyltransferase n=1 Tax=unclassified Undibacterium TaxID=2630295 RepID=UPI0033957B9B
MPRLRLASYADIPAMQALIARSAIDLSVSFYTPEQAQALLQYVFGVDTQLIADQTYFAIEDEVVNINQHDIRPRLLACGGWSKRNTLFGGDQAKQGVDNLLDPAIDPARIRAFFVDPSAARRGLGSMLMRYCTEQARAAGFTALELASTMPGEPLYRASGFEVTERFGLDLPGGIHAPLARMYKKIV